ncbi:hypothetical protein B4113_2620 [Geobacillus sp. B4113_201601]|nr:hypothetical protein B4113_2620 [Geobacillus sp. B4113_201601]
MPVQPRKVQLLSYLVHYYHYDDGKRFMLKFLLHSLSLFLLAVQKVAKNNAM